MSTADVDFSLLPDVLTEVQEHMPGLEKDLHRLVETPDAPDLLASAFRRVHTIKGDFGYARATPIMDFVHHLEGVLQSLRDGRFLCSPFVAEAILQSMDQVPPMLDHLLRTQQFDPTPRDALIALIERLAGASSQQKADDLARDILLTAHGAWLAEPEHAAPSHPAPASQNQQQAWALGEQLAEALAKRHPPWARRARFQLDCVQALNRRHRRPCNADALQLAVLWHDVGLLAEPDASLHTPPTFKSPDWQRYAEHPERAAQWLLSMAPDCQEAAQIIRQHHLWANGVGIAAPAYPLPPHPGAMMLAVADLLFDRVVGLSGIDYRRAVMRTLFDVNGGLETRFDAPVINAFEAIATDLNLPA